MPKDTEVQVIPDDEKFQNMLHQINAAVEFKFDENYKNADVFIAQNGKPQLIYKAKCNDGNVDKTLLFIYETETAVTSLIKVIYNSP
jgi:hypothetical protein